MRDVEGAFGQADRKLPVLVVLHQRRSNPGRVGMALKAMGHALDIRRPCIGDPLPQTLAEHAGAVMFGGPMSANDATDWVRAEIDWLAVPLRQAKPLFGICLGAQMIARHLGAPVERHAQGRVEIGYYDIAPVDDAAGALAPVPRRVFQWHGEGFGVPAGARLLARGQGDFPNQAFSYGRAVAVQFHPEMTHQLIVRWLALSGHRLAEPGARPIETVLDDHRLCGAAIAGWLDEFLEGWLAGSSGTAESTKACGAAVTTRATS
ncbi:MAG: glutamine amidotransferase [Hyphomicrobiaceae bacterium]|nr:glutamine amidotransferase [Hyphomicrobiaceae bacterium]